MDNIINAGVFYSIKPIAMACILGLLSISNLFAHNEKEFTFGNTEGRDTEIRNMLYKIHREPQPGIDLPEGGFTKGRIAIDSDGNVFAPDDLGAIPWGIGILWSTGH